MSFSKHQKINNQPEYEPNEKEFQKLEVKSTGEYDNNLNNNIINNNNNNLINNNNIINNINNINNNVNNNIKNNININNSQENYPPVSNLIQDPSSGEINPSGYKLENMIKNMILIILILLLIIIIVIII